MPLFDRLHVVAGEYPPAPGGVGDYTIALATALAKHGLEVHVWARGSESPSSACNEDGVLVHRCLQDFQYEALQAMEQLIKKAPGPRTVLVQYVPHAFGKKAMNIPFARWVRQFGLRGEDVRIMFHEVAYPWVKHPLHHNLLAAVNEWMARQMIQGASQIYVSTSAWNKRLVRLGASPQRIRAIAIPSNIPECADRGKSRAIHSSLTHHQKPIVLGHFGTYGKWITQCVTPIVSELIQRRKDFHLHLLGGGSVEYRDQLVAMFPDRAQDISATGRIAASEISEHIAACDLMIQPYPDGANTRRTSLMASLYNEVATISNHGWNTEPIWEESHAVALAESESPFEFANTAISLVEDSSARVRQAQTGKRAYEENFSMEQTVVKLTKKLKKAQ